MNNEICEVKKSEKGIVKYLKKVFKNMGEIAILRTIVIVARRNFAI